MEGVNIGQREWLSLNDFSCYSALYVEDQLVWARRVLPNENNNPVAWPAKVRIIWAYIVQYNDI